MSKTNSNNLSRSPNTKKDWTASSLSPVSKLLGNRPTVVQSLVSKVEAISFEGTPPSDHHHQHHQQHQHHHQQQPNLPDSSSLSRPSSSLHSPSPQGSPPYSLTSSPNLNDINPHLEEFVRETPTIRQLKTSLRSRLQTDSDRHQKRFSEDSGKSDSTDHHPRQAIHTSPHKLVKPTSLQPISQDISLPPSNIKSALPSSSSNLRPAISSSQDLSPQTTTEISSSHRSSSNHSHGKDPLQTSLANKSCVAKEAQGDYSNLLSVNQQDCDVSFGSNPSATERPIQSRHSTRRSKTSTDLPDLRLPLINFNLSPPTIALWSVEAYNCEQRTTFADLIAHLIILPLHTALAIINKLPVVGGHRDLNPLSSQAEKEGQGILLTASQIAIGLVLASGWKVIRRILN
ncbi:hypothetical protein PGT21_037011 [Puccinia graminis f. sp. tritici]|uniref:Uncharacterized protein n=2 Tax=Puccinia graminis f. sp. tritici TaxID=56615 RepID=E3KWI3_PUCGT|nr:uncharacterized protein PGTG_14863 [Puccinia graminis f. sp. tritici CRL 75-36-700-3]EFP88658.2 hypothetical protein PGTG_14863 [Puccinia graminis f. sp. tritici CRL 75-36-700-3]KAA1111176.1 hypothetical protein PGT21_037011 [Puccinia graminis f. sp. tritici]KAA1138775.1 hypothetical protein PGTUg99_004966 [Puccinia graminis f. sp. tritici]